jgi:hypothetical protein
MAVDHRDRRVADSAKLQELISDLSKVPPSSRMYYIHDELMHAIDASLATHQGHRFEEPETSVIKDIAFAIVYVLDPKNLQQKRLIPRLMQEFRAASIFGKITAIAACLAFVLGTANGVVEFAERSVALYDRFIKEEPGKEPATSQSTTVAEPSSTPTLPQKQSIPKSH